MTTAQTIRHLGEFTYKGAAFDVTLVKRRGRIGKRAAARDYPSLSAVPGLRISGFLAAFRRWLKRHDARGGTA